MTFDHRVGEFQYAFTPAKALKRIRFDALLDAFDLIADSLLCITHDARLNRFAEIIHKLDATLEEMFVSGYDPNHIVLPNTKSAFIEVQRLVQECVEVSLSFHKHEMNILYYTFLNNVVFHKLAEVVVTGKQENTDHVALWFAPLMGYGLNARWMEILILQSEKDVIVKTTFEDVEEFQQLKSEMRDLLSRANLTGDTAAQLSTWLEDELETDENDTDEMGPQIYEDMMSGIVTETRELIEHLKQEFEQVVRMTYEIEEAEERTIGFSRSIFSKIPLFGSVIGSAFEEDFHNRITRAKILREKSAAIKPLLVQVSSKLG
jgi:hypothetical protein